MTKEKRLEDIKKHPKKHEHDYDGLLSCCAVDGVIDAQLMDAHPALGRNGGVNCDVTEGPCSCGAWH